MLREKYDRVSHYVFWLGLAISVIMPFVFYKSFNNIIYADPVKPNADSDNIAFYVDRCDFNKGKLVVSGWATPMDGVGGIVVFASLDDKTIKLNTTRINRSDVSSALKKPGFYDKSGFSASINYGVDVNSVRIYLQITKSENIYVVSHDCE